MSDLSLHGSVKTHLIHKAFSVSWIYTFLLLLLQSWRLAHSSRVQTFNRAHWLSFSPMVFKKEVISPLIFGALGLRCYALAFSCCSEQGLLSKGDTQAYSSGFSCCKAQALGHAGFNSCSLWALERGLSSCGSQGLLALRPV